MSLPRNNSIRPRVVSSTVALIAIFVLAPLAGIILVWRLGVTSPILAFAAAFAGQLMAISAYMAWGQYRAARLMTAPRAGNFIVFVGGQRTPRQHVDGVIMLALYAAFITAVAYGVRALVRRGR